MLIAYYHYIHNSDSYAYVCIYSYNIGKHWSKAEGGCEGVNNPEAPIIQPSVIRQNGELYRRYNNQFPLSTTGGASDRARLLVKLDVIKVHIRCMYITMCT